MLSSASMSFPRYTSPVFVSQVTMCPSASCRTLIGTPIDISAGREFYREREREREIRELEILILFLCRPLNNTRDEETPNYLGGTALQKARYIFPDPGQEKSLFSQFEKMPQRFKHISSLAFRMLSKCSVAHIARFGPNSHLPYSFLTERTLILS